MSISSATRKAGPYTGNGVTVAFPFSFKVFAAGDVRVVRTDLSGVETDLALTTDFTVSLNTNQDSNPGGTITTVTPPASGILITLTSALQNLQPVTLTNAGGFYPKVINDALDRVTIQIQQLAEAVGRTVKVGISSLTSPDVLMAALAGYVTSAWGYANGASASASAAAASASAAAASASAAAASQSAAAVSAAAAALSGVPVGATVFIPGTAAPSGFIKKNGALLSRTAYANLWAFAQSSGNLSTNDGTWTVGQFSPGDGSTTFRIPDGRAEFVRGFDDGRGVDSGRQIGSSQSDQVKDHTHALAHAFGAGTVQAGASYYGTLLSASTTGNVSSGAGSETRPRNVAELACIKY